MYCFRPFSVVSSDDIRAHIKYGRILLNTFENHPHFLTTCVAHNIFLAFSDRFALVFDGQSTLEAHYVAVSATLPRKIAAGNRAVCLAMLLLKDETTHGAEEHVSFLQFISSVFAKEVFNVAALIEDSCSVSRSISKKMKVLSIGCASHRF